MADSRPVRRRPARKPEGATPRSAPFGVGPPPLTAREPTLMAPDARDVRLTMWDRMRLAWSMVRKSRTSAEAITHVTNMTLSKVTNLHHGGSMLDGFKNLRSTIVGILVGIVTLLQSLKVNLGLGEGTVETIATVLAIIGSGYLMFFARDKDKTNDVSE